jgi:hypothetical protein
MGDWRGRKKDFYAGFFMYIGVQRMEKIPKEACRNGTYNLYIFEIKSLRCSVANTFGQQRTML